MTKLKQLLIALAFVAVIFGGQLKADIIIFDAVWTSVTGGPAMAVAKFEIDDSILPNPGATAFGDPFAAAGIGSFVLEVSGASAGNGVFVEADFDGGLVWDTFGATLDLTTELVGQPTAGDPWGTPSGGGGDFNLFSSTGAPTGTFFFTLTTASGAGDTLVLSSFAPRAVPEPSSLAFLTMGLVGFVSRRGRKNG